MITDLGLVTFDESGKPVVGCAAYLRAPQLPGGFLFDITNADGYARFEKVPVPFAGSLKMTGGCQFYERNVSVPEAINVTIRVGPSPSNPQDVSLEPCVPFV